MKLKTKETVGQVGFGAKLLSTNEDSAIPQTQLKENQLKFVPERSYQKIDSVVIGRLMSFNDLGQPLVAYPGNPYCHLLPAHSIVSLSEDDKGRGLVLQFENSDPGRPIILGLLQPNVPVGPETRKKSHTELEVDGEKLIFTADKEIVLRCGEASITLTRAGKIIIRGAYLVSRSTGVNRIKGGSVQIN